MKLRDYQEQSVDFLYERDRAMILASVGAFFTILSASCGGGFPVSDLLPRFGHLLLFVWSRPKHPRARIVFGGQFLFFHGPIFYLGNYARGGYWGFGIYFLWNADWFDCEADQYVFGRATSE